MPADNTLSDAQKTLLTQEAGTGRPPSITTEEALAYHAARVEEARYLEDLGIRLVLPSNAGQG